MRKEDCWIKNSFTIGIILLLTIPFAFSEEFYLFHEGDSLLITNTPAPGYIGKVGNSPLEIKRKHLAGNFSDLDSYIKRIGKRYSVSPLLIKAIIKAESDFNPQAVSSEGAKGLMQLMDATALEFGVRHIFDPYENIKGGTKYLRYLLDLFEGDLSLTLAAYNAGIDTVLNFQGIPPYSETIQYIEKVLKIMKTQERRSEKEDHRRASKIWIEKDRNGHLLMAN